MDHFVQSSVHSIPNQKKKQKTKQCINFIYIGTTEVKLYRDPTFPHDRALGDSGEEKLPFNEQKPRSRLMAGGPLPSLVLWLLLLAAGSCAATVVFGQTKYVVFCHSCQIALVVDSLTMLSLYVSQQSIMSAPDSCCRYAASHL